MSTAIIGVICLSLFLAVAQCPAADETAGKTITKTFTVEPGGTLSVDADQGDIVVLTGKQDVVEVVVKREVSGGSEAAQTKALKANQITFSQDGKDIQVESKTIKKTGSMFSREPNLGIHFQITLPRRFNASLNTSGGNIEVKDLDGTVDARTSGGGLNFAKIKGAVNASTSGGNITATGCADKLTVQTSGGNIVITDFSGPNASADTSGGNVEVVACTGRLQIKTSGGNIDVEHFTGPTAYADTSGGAIAIGIDQQPIGDCWLHTSGGNITARLPETVALNLNASTDGGSVSSALPVTVLGKQQDGKLEGKINGGGPSLLLKTTGGDIQILKR